MIYGTLRVTSPDGQVREYPMEFPDTVVGRSQGVGITLDHVSVSRRHAALQVDGSRLLVQDLGSASGTFVGGQRIEPQQQHSVAPGQMIRFGDCEATFIGSEPEPAPPEPPAAEPVAPVTPAPGSTSQNGQPAPAITPEAGATVLSQPGVQQSQASTGEPAEPGTPSTTPAAPEPAAPAAPSTGTNGGEPPSQASVPVPPPSPAPAPPRLQPRQQERPSTIAVTLASPTTPVPPGGTATATIVVQNRGNVVDQVSLSVPELDPSWVQVRRTSLSLVPGARDEVTIVLKPPKHSSAVAGEHQFAVSVVSAETGNEVRALGKFTILPFEQFNMSLRGRSGGRTTVVLRNEGNSPITRTIVPLDDEEALKYAVDQEEVELAPGEEKTVTIGVKPRRRNPFGQNKFYRFKVEARAKSGAAQTVQTPGNYAYKAPLRHWRYMLGGLLLASLVGGGYWAWRTDRIPFFGGGSDDPDPTPTVSVVPGTETAPPTDTPVASVTPTITVNGTITVINAPEDNQLRLRTSPSSSGEVIARLPNGVTATVLEGPTDADGARYWRIRTADGQEGWAAEMLLGATGDPVDVGPWMEPNE